MAKLEFSVNSDTEKMFRNASASSRMRVQKNIEKVVRFFVSSIEKEQTDSKSASQLIQKAKKSAKAAKSLGAPQTDKEIQDLIENS
ncbi:MAG: hypothetical protein HRT90_02460 [Candidatus Margulisbacteria bacterium]|nr:hypothetical protein [Candidatus Margulisiibacteriota bacterium]